MKPQDGSAPMCEASTVANAIRETSQLQIIQPSRTSIIQPSLRMPQDILKSGGLSLEGQGLEELSIQQGQWMARFISPNNLEDKRAYQRLRYTYFVRQRGWVTPSSNSLASGDEGLEHDRYDDFAWHLGVYQGGELAVYMRLLPYIEEIGFMLEHEFQPLIQPLTRQMGSAPWVGAVAESVELSRLVCRAALPLITEASGNYSVGVHTRVGKFSDPQLAHLASPLSLHPVELLLKLLFRLMRHCGYRDVYIVVEEKWLAPFARRFGLTFQVLGDVYCFPDGTRTVAAGATLDELDAAMQYSHPVKHAWYHRIDTLN